MHIGVDCSSVAKAERTGVARYCVSLLRTLPSVLGPGDRVTLLYRLSRIKRRKWFERIDDPRFGTAMFDDRIVPFGRRGADVVHGPDLRIPLFPGIPAVSTVHDLSALELPGIASESFRRRKVNALRTVAERAAVIICISEYTEQSFLERFPTSESRTRVVPLGLAERFRPRTADEIASVRERLGIGPRYLLFVGQISARKNLAPLFLAFGALRGKPRFHDVELVLAGPVQTGGDDLLAQAGTRGLDSGVHTLGFVGDDVLPALYSGAAAFCFTGKAEGFGLPILEAMACGCPVVIARAGASESTAGGAARIVEPDDPDALHDSLADLLDSEAARDELIAPGLVRAAEFSWRTTALRTLTAYRDAIELGARS